MKRSTVSLIVLLIAGAAGTLVLAGCQQKSAGRAGPDVHVNVTDNGFEPAEVRIRAGRSVALIMTRKTDQTCATEVEFASLHRKYALPLNQPVRITLPASPAGTLSYECGMHMVGGRILVR